MRSSIRRELGLERREVFHQQRRQEPILAKRQKIFLVQCVDVRLRVFVNDPTRDNDGTALVSGPDAVHGETSRQTGHGTEQTLKRFRQMMRDVVLIDLAEDVSVKITVVVRTFYLNHGPPRTFLVLEPGFTTYANDARIVCGGCYQTIQ